MRPPNQVINGPSSIILTSAEALVVQGESLGFNFEEKTATVTAEYQIHCEQPREFDHPEAVKEQHWQEVITILR